jgi:mRNA-degrading endonuclease toxin of MazEF toxin-antitoxin module
VVPLTSQVDALRFPGTILVEKDERNGLRRDSIAMLFQLTVLDRRSIKEQLGAVTAEVITAMYQVLDEITERSGSAADAAEEQL